VKVVPPKVWSKVAFDPAKRWPMVLGLRLSKDFFSASTFAAAFDGRLPGANVSMLGVRPSLLRRLGYRVTRVPTVNGRLERCRPLVGQAGTRCWARLDQYLMQRVVPWVPMIFQTTTRAVSARVLSFSFDQLTTFPALDRIAVAGG
jgi:hypothetical protein